MIYQQTSQDKATFYVHPV